MREDLAKAHREAVAELLDHRAHQHPWADQDRGWVLSRSRAGTFTLETMGRLQSVPDGHGSWLAKVSLVDVTDRSGWPGQAPPPGYMLRMWAAQFGGMLGAAATHPQVSDELWAADRDTRTGVVDLGPVAGFGLTRNPGPYWAWPQTGDGQPPASGPRPATLDGLAGIQAALPDQCWIEGSMIMGPPSTDLREILALGDRLHDNVNVDLRDWPDLATIDPLAAGQGDPLRVDAFGPSERQPALGVVGLGR